MQLVVTELVQIVQAITSKHCECESAWKHPLLMLNCCFFFLLRLRRLCVRCMEYGSFEHDAAIGTNRDSMDL